MRLDMDILPKVFRAARKRTHNYLCYRRNSTFKESSENDRESPGAKNPHLDKEKETASTLALQQLIARVLIDPSTSVPLDSNSLHKKVALHLPSLLSPLMTQIDALGHYLQVSICF